MSASISLVDLGGGLIRQIDPSLNGDNELLVGQFQQVNGCHAVATNLLVVHPCLLHKKESDAVRNSLKP